MAITVDTRRFEGLPQLSVAGDNDQLLINDSAGVKKISASDLLRNKLSITGGQMTGELKNSSNSAYRLNYGGGRRGFLHKDDNSFHILFADTPDGGHNGIIPLHISLASGATTITERLLLSHPLEVSQGGTNANNATDGFHELATRGYAANIDGATQSGIWHITPATVGTFPSTAGPGYGLLNVYFTIEWSMQMLYHAQVVHSVYIRQRWGDSGWTQWYRYTGLPE